MKKILTVFILPLLLSFVNLYGQEPIVGLYCDSPGGFTFNVDGTFEISDYFFYPGSTISERWRCGQPIFGRWQKINDSTFFAKLDTLVSTTDYDDHPFNEMLCTLFKRDSYTMMRLDIKYTDIYEPFIISYMKIAWFYPNNKMRSQLSSYPRMNFFEVVTNHFSNGVIQDVICSEKGVKEGNSLKYCQNGQLASYQRWHKGKLKYEEKFPIKDKGEPTNYPYNIPKNDTTYSVSGNHWITTYYPNGFSHEIISYKKGVKDGPHFRYNIAGRLECCRIWRKGKLIGRTNFWNLQWHDLCED